MATNIKTTGDLREFLVNSMLGLKNGQMDFQTATGVMKLASQVNESFYSEIKIAKFRTEASLKVADLGKLAINA